MPFPQWYAGQTITAERLNARNMIMVEQDADREITNTQVTWVSSDISLDLEPYAMYAYWLYISYSAGTGGFAWSWASSGVTLASFTQAYNLNVGTGDINDGGGVIFRRPANTTARVAGGSGATRYNSAYDSGTMNTSGGSPSLTLRFQQDSASTQATTLRGGNQTRLLYQRIG